MPSNKSCCAASAAKMVKKLNIGGTLIGISMCDEIIAEVSHIGLNDEKEIAKELLKRVKMYNYVTPQAENEYADTMLNEYKKIV